MGIETDLGCILSECHVAPEMEQCYTQKNIGMEVTILGQSYLR